MFYRSVDLFYNPEDLCNKITDNQSKKYSEMSSFEKAFLCGLLREKKPRKILEIGVSGGGTTAVILTCLKLLDYEAEMYSVDVSEEWYRVDTEETGFVAKKYMKQINNKVNHKFLLGNPIPYVIDAIGKGIDFLILDTTHVLPGELLDFLICYPYLDNECIVVVHDVIENHLSCDNNRIATKLLFDLVWGDKWYMHEKILYDFYPTNIAAFRINEIGKGIYNIFSALSFSWEYILNETHFEQYVVLIKKNYGEEYEDYLRKIMRVQKDTQIRKQICAHYHMSHEFLRLKWIKQKNVFLYGTGYWSQIYSEYAKTNLLPVNGYVISDEQNIVSDIVDGKKIYKE